MYARTTGEAEDGSALCQTVSGGREGVIETTSMRVQYILQFCGPSHVQIQPSQPVSNWHVLC